jgi:hypothetical protein
MFEVTGIARLVAALLGTRSSRGRPGPTHFSTGTPTDSPDANRIWAAVADQVAAAGARVQAETPEGGSGVVPGAGSDMVTALERLTTLHQAGNLTDEEFAAAERNLIRADS